jgi:two-component system, chemotaxis family, chemotaxis protein CheY
VVSIVTTMTGEIFHSGGKSQGSGSKSPFTAEASASSQCGTGIRILLADDDEVLRVVQADFLRRYGFEVFAVAEGKSAMRLLAKQAIDLVITDMVMPGSDGVELIQHIRKTYPKIKIIAISGGGATKRDLLLDIARVLGVTGTLEKPFTMTVLLKAVKAALGIQA